MFTALLIAMLIVAGATTVIGGGLVWQHQRRRALERAAEPRQLPAASARPHALERGPREMRPGDIAQLEGRDWVVEAVLHYDEDGHRWATGRLVDVSEVRWLVAGMDRAGASALMLLADDTSIEIGSYPPEAIVQAERRYALERRGTATVRIEGDAGPLPGAVDARSVQRCRWWRYSAAGDGRVLVEQWGSDFRTLRGTALPDGALELMPGS